MKHILRLDEDDICKILRKCYNVGANQITAIYTDAEDEKTGDIETKFFVEIEKNADKN